MNPESDDSFAITVLAAPGMPSALVCLAGDIDMMASIPLAAIIDRLSTVAPASVMIDLADVSFASATLPNFLARLHHSLPASSTMLLCRPTTSIRRILQVTGMEQIARLRADLPMSDDSPPSTFEHWPKMDDTQRRPDSSADLISF